MFGLNFLFAAGLLALPLAALPVLLHLLFRRKSPVVLFSTLRFVKASVQRTAARKRVQRWLLLACRVLLLLLLIWAIAQPVKRLEADSLAGGRNIAAAIVVDTSYSMQYRQGQTSRLDQADTIVQSLLREPLRDSRVAIFRSLPSTPAEHLETAGTIESQWTALQPQPSPLPLGERVTAAMEFLKRQDALEKWLVIITDVQSKEFAHPVADFPDGRVFLFDLHPEEPRAAGVTKVDVTPAQPLPGIVSDVGVQVSGRGGDERFVDLTVTTPDGQVLVQKPPVPVTFDAGGAAQTRFDVDLPNARWLLLTASLQQDEELPWAKSRSTLVEMPPQRIVTVLDGQAAATHILRLALGPPRNEDRDTWSLDLVAAKNLTGRENVLVAPLNYWPDEPQARRWRDFVQGGGTLILALQPGLEQAWPTLPPGQQAMLQQLLPSAPYAAGAVGAQRVAVADADDELLAGLNNEGSNFSAIVVRRFVPMSLADPSKTSIILSMSSPSQDASPSHGLLFRTTLGAGTIFTLATLPEPLYTNFYAHTRFLPLMVRMCLRPATQREAQNVELGQSLVLAGAETAGLDQLEIQGPGKELYVVKPLTDAQGQRRFEFTQAMSPGIYTWRKPNDPQPLALTNVQLPASEAQLTYQDGATIVPPADNTLTVRTYGEFASAMAQHGTPEPKWSLPIAIVLFLLCLEALMGSISKLWKPPSIRGLLARA